MKKYLIGIILFLMFVFNGYIGYNMEPVNAAQIPSEGLAAYWSFDEGSGNTVHDFSGNNNDGTVHGTTWVEGISGNALNFDGGNNYVSLPTSTLGNWNGLTYSAWVKVPEYSGSGWPGIIGSYTTDMTHNTNLGILRNTGHLHFEIDTNIGNYEMEGEISIPWNTWFHAVLVYDGSKLIEYVNGIPGKSIPATGNLKNVAELDIGQHSAGNYFLDGMIDEVCVYNRPLSESEIKDLYLSTGLVAHWNFDEGSGNTVHDLSGNNNDGTIYGAKWVDGISGNALEFDGSDDYVEVPDDDSLDVTTGITIDVWIKPGTQVDHANIIDKCHTSTDNTGWVLEYTGEILGHTTPDRVYVWSGNGSSYSHSNTEDIPITTTTLNDNSWHNVVGTYDGTTARIYVDGVEEDSSTSISGDIKITSHNLNIGRWGHIPSRYFNGTIDEVKIYNRALTEDEIKTEYDKVKSDLVESDLVAHWNFDGVSGNIAPDSAGDNDGTIHGAKVVEGVSGEALEFDGVDDYVEIPNTPELNSFSQLTTSAWVYVNGFDEWEPILNKGGTNDGATDVFEVNINSDGFVHFVLNFESSGRKGYNSPSNSISAGSWHHIVTLYDGDRAKIYIDGILVSDYDAPNEPLKYSDTSLQIGLEYGSPPESYFNGMIDEIFIFDIAISESTILELYRLSPLNDPDNKENKAAEKSPLSLIIDKKYVPVVATATSVALIYLWNIMGNSVYKFIIDFIASHVRSKKSRGKKVKKKKDFSYKFIKNMGIWEIFSIFLAILIFAIAMSWTWSADLSEFIELFIINFFVVSCILGLRESSRLYLSNKNKLKTEYVFWPFGALLTIGSTLLGNTFSLTYYIVFEKEKNVKKFGEMYFSIYLLLYSLSISAFILNFIAPSVVFQMIFVFVIMGIFIFMTPVKPMTGYSIKNWNFKKWLIFYIIVSISYLVMNFTIY